MVTEAAADAIIALVQGVVEVAITAAAAAVSRA